MFQNKKINAGDGSTNIQGQIVTVNNGISYQDVKEIAMDVFKNNFVELGKAAAKVATERAEELVIKYLYKLEEVSPQSLSNTEDPDVQYAIYTAQMHHARLGNDKILKLLVDILVKRTVNEENDLMKIVLNESLTVLPKLTIKQIDALTCILLMVYLDDPRETPLEFLSMSMQFFESIILQGNDFYRHLEYASCVTYKNRNIDHNRFEYILRYKFRVYLKDNNTTIEELLEKFPEAASISHSWDISYINSCFLTSVGIAIAQANLTRKTNVERPDTDFSFWI
ncbi:LPO_1073/Vpar_1526 family protein [Bacillus thuringiensis]|uniref:LPO_1073/Vpar_1526 family protein n=1 Tax=Bacillus thuringiensis TaxID=1428 RepID=UPI000BFDC7AD|nr:LPO_1073/Vpar_1526 family protein [Bacillus thuringiensis]PGW35152.1 hypothetical protein COE17_25180 [Bacillus thuringiensis]